MKRRTTLLAGACLSVAAVLAPGAQAKPSEHPFEIVPGSFHVTPSTLQAGAHEDLTTSFDIAHEEKVSPSTNTYNDLRTVTVNLPAGFIGSNTAVPTCTAAQLLLPGGNDGLLGQCPIASQIGQIKFETYNIDGPGHPPAEFTVPLYNMEVNSPGIAAEYGFKTAIITQILQIRVRPGDTGLTITTPNITKVEPRNISVTVWGVPAAHAHDAQRGEVCGLSSEVPPVCYNDFGGPQEAKIPIRPYLANATSCGTFEATIEAESWEHETSEAESEIGPIKECDRVPFEAEIEASPTTSAAESPTGLDFTMNLLQAWDNYLPPATSYLKDAKVTLPEGMSLNPSAGSGLGYCTEAQFSEEGSRFEPGVGCPPESKVGTVEVETPVLLEKGEGSVYVAKPFDNPFHSLVGLYVVVRVPFRGIVVKVAGEVHPDPVTGQLTTTFPNNPQVPFSKFNLHFNQGATSPLVTPPACGPATVSGALTPWSRPLESLPVTASPFEITSGVNGGACPSGGLPPFHLLLHAGSYSNQAGAYSPFYIRLSRKDGEQEITHFSIKLPPGLVGKLAGIPLCSDAAIAQAKGRTGPHGGEEEEQSPSCPAASQIGRTEVEAGVGGTLASAPGKIYLAGPYHGAPISVVAITAAKVGPFDLGTVVVREALKVNPETGEVFVDSTGSDPIPHIVDGIPTHLRNVRIYMDRPEFVLNPTSCDPTSTASTVLGSGLNFASEADDQPVTVTSFFQAANCAALRFHPTLKLRLRGKTKRGAFPALRAELTQRPGEASVGRAQVTLPHSEFLAQGHIGTVCTRVQFAAGGGNGEQCPAASVYGHARAITPILSEPLGGPVYLRSNPEHELPDLVAALHGSEINVDLVGHVEGVKGGMIRNTFETVPDAPVSKFVLEMGAGKKSLLENSEDLCVGKHLASANFTGHNGKIDDFRPALLAKCPKPHGHKGKGHRHRRHG